MLVFVHIPKTAGTTLHKIITHQYPNNKIFIRHDSDGPWDDAAVSALTTAHPQIVMGHLSVGLHEKLPGTRYLTCLREPVSRIVSHYQHALNDPAHYLHEPLVSRNLDLAEYVSSGLSGELANGTTRMLAGVPDFHHSLVTEETFQLALHNLRNRFDAVILSESFDSGLLLLADDLHWNTPWYIRRKIGKSRPEASKPDERTLRAIADHNRFDCQLHTWATRYFTERANSIPGHTQRVARFQKANQTYGKMVFCLREARSRL